MEKWIDSKRVYEGKIISVRTGDVECEDGIVAFREIVEHPGGVGIVPVIDDTILLVRQYRIAIGESILEIPAGKLEGKEEILTRAQCELEEETGYHAGTLIPAGSIFSSVGYTSEEIFLFLAFGLEHVGQRPEFDEDIEIERVSFEQAKAMMAANEIKDAKTLVALAALFRHLKV
jgi:ADP-ribose pyrophosphatase